jgi:hypothetical protein
MVGVEAVLGPGGHPSAKTKAVARAAIGQGAGQRLRADPSDLAAKQPQRPDRDAGVEQAEERAGADQPELRHEQQRKGDRDGERAEVVEGQHLRHQRLQPARAGAGVALEDAHDERDLEPDQDADRQHQGVESEAERAVPAVCSANSAAGISPPIRPTSSSILRKWATSWRSKQRDSQEPTPMANR